MVERRLNYTLSADGITPAEKLFGGVQGENGATAIVVSPDSGLALSIAEHKNQGQEVFCSFDVLSETGEFFEGEKRNIDNLSDPFYLTEGMTASGLDIIVIVKIGILDRTFYKAQIKLWFEECPAYKTLQAPKSAELELFNKRAEEIFAELERKAESAEKALEVKSSAAAASASLAAAHLNKVIELEKSAEQSGNRAEESAASAALFAADAEKDFETVKTLFSSALKNISNHNSDPASHGDIRNGIGKVDAALDNIIAIQNSLMGGERL